MVYTAAATAASSQADRSSLHLHLSTSSDVSIDILADLDAPGSEEQLHLLFQSTGSSSQAAVERMLVDSGIRTTSVISAMDAEVHRMSNTMNELTFDPVDQYDALAVSRRNSLYLDTNDLGLDSSMGRASLRSSMRSRRGRSPAANRPRKRISVKDVDFDPAPSFGDAQQHRNSQSDLSLSSFNTAQTSQVAADPLNTSSGSLANPDEQVSYHSALASLAQSMQRTEQSRRQVMLQRSLLTPNQRVALEEARNRQLQAIQTEALIPVQTPTSTRDLSPTRSSIVNAFFAGSRGTLTNGLEQSRRQLRNYMGQVQNQTL
eukprot:CAMPEP_0201729208 /NCGR_PEP_ID=MMETSP0593-20130828/18355_1 /ASSEMBLY_ACC=CAM_ASM_000672 /TAXON_ID=267983 /ORGANISM="Skeletonema japonicum, Strain CCMP2506" /LENGTH=317 /DNA_ID=CAMNT_0048221517 /DNA_START=101 /DNA_END=1054 /DNA_ORIENTATION=+